MFAPLIVFAYNRPKHLKTTLNALALNKEAKESDIFIFIDGPKTKDGEIINKEVFEVANSFSSGFFKHCEIINHNSNSGLAKSVISGVTDIINKYGKVIVTEDDAVSSPYYLKFMNEALDYYKDDSTIWSVGGYTVPMETPLNYKKDVIKTQRMSSYAWGTWIDRWTKIDWDMKEYKSFHFNIFKRIGFNRWGNDRSTMLDYQMKGEINSWAIRFDYAMYRNKMYNILPITSLINNTGHDGSGTHSKTDAGQNDKFKTDLTKAKSNYDLEKVKINGAIRKRYVRFFNYSWKPRLKTLIKDFLHI